MGKIKVFHIYIYIYNIHRDSWSLIFKSLGHATIYLFSLVRKFISSQVSCDTTDVIRSSFLVFCFMECTVVLAHDCLAPDLVRASVCFNKFKFITI